MRRASGWVALLLFAVLLAVYLANGRTIGSGDTLPARFLPLSILRHRDFYLERHLGREGRPAGAYYVRLVAPHLVSEYPVATALLAVPVYALLSDRMSAERLEKLAAAIMVAASAALLYLALTRLTDPTWALILALVYGLGTSSFSVSSQALWQHSGGQFALAAGLYAVLRGRTDRWWAGLAGLPLGLAAICRPTNAIIVAPVALYALVRIRGWSLVGWALPPLAFQLWYSWACFGALFHVQYALIDVDLWSTPFSQGLAGLLLSPGRGLLVYSPIFILSIAGAALAWRPGGDPLLRALSTGIALTILAYARWVNWWGGYSYGPRLLADLTPALTLLLCPLRPWLALRWTRVLFAGLVAWSVFAHGLGAFRDDGRWNAYPSIDRFPERLWSWGDNPLVNALTDASGRARAGLGLLPTSRSRSAVVQASFQVKPGPPAASARERTSPSSSGSPTRVTRSGYPAAKPARS